MVLVLAIITLIIDLKNNTDQDIQLLLWVENKTLYGELRSQNSFP